MAKLLGAGKVIATASSDEKLDLARSLGADVLIDYTEKDWPEKVREATGGKGTDVILEMVVFGAASHERGAIVPATLIKGCHIDVGFYCRK